MKVATMVKLTGFSMALLLLNAAPAFAQAQEKGLDHLTSISFSGAGLAAGLGMGLTIIGAGFGLGKIGAAALEAMARQPEVAPRVQTAMIIVAAMLEGATLASVALCFVVGLNAKF
jgi:F-type H+-transporting ATPase subunit c